MSEPTTAQKFKQLQQDLTQQEFNSIEFLTAKAEQLEASDPELAKRILVRVANLKKQQAQPAKPQAKLTPNSESQDKAQSPAQKASDENAAQDAEDLPLWRRWFNALKKSHFFLLVVTPTLLFAFYQLIWATDRYESQAQVIVQQPDGMATMDASMAILTGLGVSNSGVSDTELVKAYILSNDMLSYLDDKLNLREHYTQSSIDLFSSLPDDATREDFLKYYQDHLEVYIDSKSSIVHVYSQAFDKEFAHLLTETIVKRAEWYINSIGHQLAEAQLKFITHEHQNIEQRLEQAQVKLMNFQQRYNLLDPTAEGMAMQQIAYGLEGQVSSKEAELKGLSAIMSPHAPQVVQAKNQLAALKEQLIKERSKLSEEDGKVTPLSEILASYTDLKVKMELALQAYTSSQVSLEKSRIEAYRQLKYLVVVEAATQPEDNKYPDALYNISLFAALAAMLFAIGNIIVSTIRELK
ncbi:MULTISPECIES: lipopolysaccharide biosynthesis protein [Vibrio]|uniref:lipopolysaccharide biosynthesis protein n=1 Tax=Vibrio TaxID=662 RepID=UPI001CDBE686|nr:MULTISPECIES: lipopolysaccharide biosynthesis protein [Vibrio]MCA2458826.1 lipopolysaccharide biosynthesis protein [Vibrio alginolyticus]MCA2464420.1 lipopolysaccharide biosynthesis protein [Vibrio alginolyticus]MDW2270806.1 lipopolysaccharide biosynthesis protein [Vibrio sp. 1394]MDW2297727.1 lipopolysaccharide biosynthesis protein [Vibrio sp. 1404]